MKIGTFGANSRIDCLQIPQGVIGSLESDEIAIALNSRCLSSYRLVDIGK